MMEFVRMKSSTCASAATVATAVIICALFWGLVSSGRAGGDDRTAFWRHVFARPPTDAGSSDLKARRRVALGGKLFGDTRLSGDGSRSCASCHQPQRAFTDGLKRAAARPGTDAKLRNTPTLYGLAQASVFNWDASARTLEAQVHKPLHHPAELSADMNEVLANLNADTGMREAFSAAFPGQTDITYKSLATALAAYVKSLRAPRTRFDQWADGNSGVLNQQEQRGFQLFVGKGGCVACHSGWRFTDDSVHDIGLTSDSDGAGADVSGKRGVRAFKTPTLRQAEKTAPYMHDGSFTTLDDVVEHYTSGVIARKGVSQILPRDLSLSEVEKAALVAFLKTL